jgi:hypothetical protein
MLSLRPARCMCFTQPSGSVHRWRRGRVPCPARGPRSRNPGRDAGARCCRGGCLAATPAPADRGASAGLHRPAPHRRGSPRLPKPERHGATSHLVAAIIRGPVPPFPPSRVPCLLAPVTVYRFIFNAMRMMVDVFGHEHCFIGGTLRASLR